MWAASSAPGEWRDRRRLRVASGVLLSAPHPALRATFPSKLEKGVRDSHAVCGQAVRPSPALAFCPAPAHDPPPSALWNDGLSDMGFKCGIVGLPNVGKSTLFNALTQTAAAQAANYPFGSMVQNG